MWGFGFEKQKYDHILHMVLQTCFSNLIPHTHLFLPFLTAAYSRNCSLLADDVLPVFLFYITKLKEFVILEPALFPSGSTQSQDSNNNDSQKKTNHLMDSRQCVGGFAYLITGPQDTLLPLLERPQGSMVLSGWMVPTRWQVVFGLLEHSPIQQQFTRPWVSPWWDPSVLVCSFSFVKFLCKERRREDGEKIASEWGLGENPFHSLTLTVTF